MVYDVSDALDAFVEPATLTRHLVGAYANGIWTEGAATSSAINLVAYPESDGDTLRTQAGDRRQDA